MNAKGIFNSGLVKDLKHVRTITGATLEAHNIKKVEEAQEFYSQEWGMNFWAVKIGGEWQQATGFESQLLNRI